MSTEPSVKDAGALAVLLFFLRNARVIFGLSFIVGIAVYFLSALMQPVYQSDVLVVPAEESGGGALSSLLSGFGGLGRLAGIGSSGTSRTDEAKAMLRSRTFVSRFIDENNGYALLYPKLWDVDSNTWKTSTRTPPSFQRAHLLFTTSVLSVREDKETGTIRISMKLKDRFAAAEWANAIVSQLNETFRQQVAAESQKSIDYLNGELENASSVELRQSIHRMIEAQIQSIMLANVRKDFVFRVIDPAVVSDADNNVSPRRVLLAFVGLIIGGLLGLGFVLIRDASRAGARAESSSSETSSDAD